MKDEKEQDTTFDEADGTPEANDDVQLDSSEKKTYAVLKELTSDTSELRQNFSLRRVLGGDILTSDWLRHQIWLILLVALLAVVYITNRYQSQQELLEINALKETLMDLKYDALSRSSELTQKSRQSHIERFLKERNDSLLQKSETPPYVIKNKNK